MLVSLSFVSSLRQGVPGAEEGRQRRRSPLRHESAEEGVDRAEEEDHRAHENRTPSARGRPR